MTGVYNGAYWEGGHIVDSADPPYVPPHELSGAEFYERWREVTHKMLTATAASDTVANAKAQAELGQLVAENPTRHLLLQSTWENSHEPDY